MKPLSEHYRDHEKKLFNKDRDERLINMMWYWYFTGEWPV